jgi:hypothetical protein
MSMTTSNMSLERGDIDIFKEILCAAISGLVVELQRIKRDTLKITNQSQAVK